MVGTTGGRGILTGGGAIPAEQCCSRPACSAVKLPIALWRCPLHCGGAYGSGMVPIAHRIVKVPIAAWRSLLHCSVVRCPLQTQCLINCDTTTSALPVQRTRKTHTHKKNTSKHKQIKTEDENNRPIGQVTCRR